MSDKRAITFTGRIYPERTAVGITTKDAGLELHLEFRLDSGAQLPARILIAYSQVVVTIAEPEPFDDVMTLKNQVQSVVSSLADIVGWLNGCGYVAEITSYASSEAQGVFGVQIPVLSAKKSRLDATTIFGLVLSGLDGIYLRRSFADLRSAILSPDDTPFFCFRAVEAVTKHFPGTKAKARASMCASLRVDDGWVVAWLQRPANEIRHGAVIPVTDEGRQRSLLAAWEVIERYMVWRISGEAAFPADEFPRLRKQDDPLMLRA